MTFYVVPSATDAMATTAAVPAGVPWVGQYDPAAATYLIATPADLSGVQGVTAVSDLAAECARRGLQVADVLRWSC